MKPVQECWLAARGDILPKGLKANTPEELELRRVFFVGALCLLQMQQGTKDLPPDHLAEFEADITAELSVFRATVGTALEGLV